MSLFRRKARPESESLEEIENSPEYLAAQELVDKAPPPPPSPGQYLGTFPVPSRPQFVDAGEVEGEQPEGDRPEGDRGEEDRVD